MSIMIYTLEGQSNNGGRIMNGLLLDELFIPKIHRLFFASIRKITGNQFNTPRSPDQDDLDEQRQLFRAIARGSEPGFALLFHSYQRRVFSFAYKMTRSVEEAHDLSQSFFLSIWKNREKLEEVDFPNAYINRAIYNMALKYLRRKGNEQKYEQYVKLHLDKYSQNTLEKVAERDLNSLTEGALELMPDLKKRVYILRAREKREYEEISKLLQIRCSTARSYYRDALKIVKDYIARHYDPPANQ